jgi:hypothetical protein
MDFLFLSKLWEAYHTRLERDGVYVELRDTRAPRSLRRSVARAVHSIASRKGGSSMFMLSTALLALAVIFGLFAVLGVAGGGALVASLVLLLMASASMIAYWRRRDVAPGRSR